MVKVVTRRNYKILDIKDRNLKSIKQSKSIKFIFMSKNSKSCR